MEHYNFWQDLFDTYQSLSDWMKFAWLVVPPAFLLGFAAMVMRYRLSGVAAPGKGSLAYTVFADKNGGLRIYTHDGAGAARLRDGGMEGSYRTVRNAGRFGTADLELIFADAASQNAGEAADGASS